MSIKINVKENLTKNDGARVKVVCGHASKNDIVEALVKAFPLELMKTGEYSETKNTYTVKFKITCRKKIIKLKNGLVTAVLTLNNELN